MVLCAHASAFTWAPHGMRARLWLGSRPQHRTLTHAYNAGPNKWTKGGCIRSDICWDTLCRPSNPDTTQIKHAHACQAIQSCRLANGPGTDTCHCATGSFDTVCSAMCSRYALHTVQHAHATRQVCSTVHCSLHTSYFANVRYTQRNARHKVHTTCHASTVTGTSAQMAQHWYQLAQPQPTHTTRSATANQAATSHPCCLNLAHRTGNAACITCHLTARPGGPQHHHSQQLPLMMSVAGEHCEAEGEPTFPSHQICSCCC